MVYLCSKYHREFFNAYESQMKKILVTGGAGYIGSHTCVELLNAGYEVVVVDNLSNSKETALERVSQITGKTVDFIKVDLLDMPALQKVFSEHRPDSVIHFAGFKAVGESTEMPLAYYHNNVGGTLNLLQAMRECAVHNLVFSSSCTVYGNPETLPIQEDSPLSSASPYGATKLMIENILRDLYAHEAGWNLSILRYFNPVGAHVSGLIGEDPNGIPDNLMPYIQQVAVGNQQALRIWGNDYPTHDGTGVRDYIHVTDLALGHIRALEKLQENPGLITHNLGTGQGYSVLDVVKAFECASGKQIPYEILDRRAGDIAEIWADPQKARDELNWSAEHDLGIMCFDAWNWQQKNPNGYS
ncbi:MAG: UDP-glucose 4-epimerase [Lysobacterales bacterium]|jgi:UDP-glucose 4-epimerase